MRKPKNIQPINREDKAKNSRNRGYVMKYPWIRDEISVDIWIFHLLRRSYSLVRLRISELTFENF